MDLHGILNFTIQAGPLRIVAWEVLYVLVLVNVLTVILDRFLFRPVVGVLDERQRRLAESAEETARQLAAFDAVMRDHADQLAGSHREAVGILDASRRDADAQRRVQIEDARKTAAGRIAIAKEAVDKAARKANNDLRLEVMERLGRRIASTLLGREIA